MDSTGTTNHLWDGQNILLEANGSNAINVAYTLEPKLYGNVISESQSGVESFYLFDGIGSTRELTDSAASISCRYVYDSWGNAIQSTGSIANPYRYQGLRVLLRC